MSIITVIVLLVTIFLIALTCYFNNTNNNLKQIYQYVFDNILFNYFFFINYTNPKIHISTLSTFSI